MVKKGLISKSSAALTLVTRTSVATNLSTAGPFEVSKPSQSEDGRCFFHPAATVLRGNPRQVRSKLGQLLVWACGAPFQHPREDRLE